MAKVGRMKAVGVKVMLEVSEGGDCAAERLIGDGGGRRGGGGVEAE